MEVFLRNVHPDASELDVKCAFARILHNPPFQVNPPINFDVRLFKGKGRRHGGSKLGNLTLPTREAGNSLVQLYPRVRIKGQVVEVRISNRAVNEGILRRIMETEWQDPDALIEEEVKLRARSQPIPLESFAFGRLRKDNVFSPEVILTGECSITLDMFDRKFILAYQTSDDPTDDVAAPSEGDQSDLHSVLRYLLLLDQALELKESMSVALFPASSIVALARAGPLGVVVEAESPPTIQVLNLADSSTIRASTIDGNDVLDYVGRQFYLQFKVEEHVSLFWERCLELRSLRSPSPVPVEVTVQQLGIYSEENLVALDNVLKDVNFEIAFEAHKAVLRGILEPTDVAELQPTITRMIGEYSTEFADIFRVFISNLDIVRLNAKTGNSRRRRRRHRHRSRNTQSGDPSNAQPSASLKLQLEEARHQYISQLQRPRNRLRSLSTPTTLRSFFLSVTPSTMILEGPLPDQGNSVLRRFGHHESFLRVSFEDEDRSKIRTAPNSSIFLLLQRRFRPLLTNGLKIAGHRYEFLGYSMSGLRQHSVWFVCPYTDEDGVLMNAEEIRRRLGNFSSIAYKPARLAARWAQAFSTSDPSVTLNVAHIKPIEDRISSSGSCFTDGCGTISTVLLHEVWSHMRRSKGSLSGLPRPPPSCLQFRYGGYKGTLVEDNRSAGKTVALRPSQKKFDAPISGTLDITGTSFRPIAMFLNRPLIMLMEYHGVSQDHVFILQKAAVDDVHKIFTSFGHASYIFESHGLGTSFRLPSLFNRLHKQLGFKPYNLSNPNGLRHELIDISMCYGATQVLREIKYRARIPVPGSVTLFGVSDEYDCLNEGEIFATVYDYRTGKVEPIEGRVLITRSPQIHPGDLQVVTAVRRPQLEHLTNVVVFSCRGDRSLASCLAGGDLDGDIFNLILDPGLMPRTVCSPGSYKGLQDKKLRRPCTVDDIADFIIDYIQSDILGQIAILHLRIADKHDAGHGDCIKLAELASHAVDFPKTGTPVSRGALPKLPSDLKPDFLAREGTDPSGSDSFYPSNKLLGRLFRNVPMKIFPPDEEYAELTHGSKIRAALPAARNPPAPVELRREMEDLLEAYRDQLLTIADANSLSPRSGLSEGELLSGTIQATWNDYYKRRDAMVAMNIQTQELVTLIRRDFRGELERRTDAQGEGTEDDSEDDSDEDEDDRREETLRRAYAAWMVAEEAVRQEPKGFGIQSFGLIALGTILDVLAKERRF